MMVGSVRAWRRVSVVALAVLALPSLGSPTQAASQEGEDQQEGATYARVSHLEADLTIERPAQGEVFQADLNTPVAAGDTLSTGGGRAEIELADSSMVWMDLGTRVAFRTLADASSRFERTDLLAVETGSIRVDVYTQNDADAVFQIDTAAGSVYLLSSGSFRIETREALTTLSAYSGVAEFSGDTGSVLVRSGQRSSVQAGRSPAEPRRFNTQRPDEFDRFHQDRLAARLVPAPEDEETSLPVEVRMYAPELSRYGAWQTIPTYGHVWRPYYSGVWSPYSHGHWAWYPTGWVWISYDPWGWAPYHYGRWDYVSSVGWFWIPGAIWNGAWVTFAFGPSYVGWCPLNYWNRPVFHDAWIVSQPVVTPGRLDHRAWQFVPIDRFTARGADQVVVPRDRLPRTTDLVVTTTLPRFDPAVIAKRPEKAAALVETARRSRVAPPAAQSPAGEPVSFRALERRTLRQPAPASTQGTPTAPARPGSVPRSSSGTTRSHADDTRGGTGGHTGVPPARPAPVPSRPPREGGRSVPPVPPTQAAPPAQDPNASQDRTKGRAVERLIEGTRPPSDAPKDKADDAQKPRKSQGAPQKGQDPHAKPKPNPPAPPSDNSGGRHR
jgi:hypothetical protein